MGMLKVMYSDITVTNHLLGGAIPVNSLPSMIV